MSRQRAFLYFFLSILTLSAFLCIGTLSSKHTLLFLPVSFWQQNKVPQATPSSRTSPVILIDAGHGGADPGKIGTAKTLEKQINLEIALLLKEILQNQDITVIMTREKDEDLSTDPKHFKISDMENRIAKISESKADLVISIHQNSYTSPSVYGAQCFYYTGSKESEALASFLQEQIIRSTKQTKIRQIKDNNDYYLLKHSPSPTVIVECGFLSNPTEEQLLTKHTYQRKLAWAISLGIQQYLNSLKDSSDF